MISPPAIVSTTGLEEVQCTRVSESSAARAAISESVGVDDPVVAHSNCSSAKDIAVNTSKRTIGSMSVEVGLGVVGVRTARESAGGRRVKRGGRRMVVVVMLVALVVLVGVRYGSIM